MQIKGDVITDLMEDMGAEQKARTAYDNILRLSDDSGVNDVIRFLQQREEERRFFKAKPAFFDNLEKGRSFERPFCFRL